MREALDRRTFLKLTALRMAAGALALAGCTSPTTAPGRCSPNLSGNLQPVDIKSRLAQSDEIYLTVENTNGALSDDRIRSLALSERGDVKSGVWIGYNAQIPDTVGYLNLGADQRIEKCGPVKGESIKGRVNAIDEHHEFGVVAATDRWSPTDRFGVYIMERGSTRWTQHLPEGKIHGDQSYAVYIDRSGAYVGTWEGIRRWDGKRWYEETKLMPEERPQPVHAISRTHTNKIPSDFWIGLLKGGLYRVNPDNPQNNFLFTHENTPELASDNVRSLAVGIDGRVWVGCDPGLSVIDPVTNKVTRIDMQRVGEDKEVLGLAFDSRNRTLVASDIGLSYINEAGVALSIMKEKANGVVVIPSGYAPGFPELVVAATEGHGLYLIKAP